MLLFFNAQVTESLTFVSLIENINSGNGNEYKIVKVDMATKKTLAAEYNIEKVPAVVVLDQGKIVKRLDCVMDKEIIKNQLGM
ncbi:MAG: thioredoxin family protein [Peptococcaceae bacterium]|nr:thioredoxin family protein [Peptococcaceae bacterium]